MIKKNLLENDNEDISKKEFESFTMRPPRLYVGIYAVCGGAFCYLLLCFKFKS